MTAERDPRVNPRPGDVLQLKRRGKMQVLVTAVDVRGVSYEQETGGTWAAIANAEYWCTLAKTATIVKRGVTP